METTIHSGFGHGLKPGTTHDINCASCKADLLHLRQYPESRDVYAAILKLNKQGRTTNNSQIASATGLSRARAAEVARMLKQRHYIKDISPEKCAAYHWRPTGKPMTPVPDGEPGPERLARMFPMGDAR